MAKKRAARQTRSPNNDADRSQALWVQFLNQGIELAFKFCDTAVIEQSNPDVYARLGDNVRREIRTLSGFTRQVSDLKQRSEIQERLADLDDRATQRWRTCE